MIKGIGLSKQYVSQVLFDSVDFVVGAKERIGLVGRNGHGKSTLFKIILGQEEADAGSIQIPEHYKVGSLAQHLTFTESTVLAEVEKELPLLEGGWRETHKAEQVLQGLGFDSEMMGVAPSILSGGYQIRINLARLLVSESDLLLLDEPSNYLDIVSIRWLVDFLQRWQSELLLITHDRHFMDAVVTHTMGIHRGKLRKIPGITGKYYAQIEQDERIHEQSRVNQEKRRAETEQFVTRFRAKASKASAVQSRIKALEKEEKIEKLSDIASLDFRFRFAEFRAKSLLEVSSLGFGYGSSSLFQDISFAVARKDRIAVIGQNGKGKSTLLRLLAEELEPKSGKIIRPAYLQTAYFGQSNIERLDPSLSIEEEVLSCFEEGNRTAARNVCGQMMFSGEAAEKKIKVLSGGERSRVMLGKVLATKANLLLLDEPTNHLDMESAAALQTAIKEFPGAVIMVSHDEGLVREVAKRLVVFDKAGASVFEGGYDNFLRTIGWSSEPEPEKSKSNSADSSKKLDKKARRQIRAAINQKRTKELRPLEIKLQKLEKEIVALEDHVAMENEAIIEASKEGFGDDVAKRSRELHTVKAKIDTLFAQFEETGQAVDTLRAEIEKDLEAIT